LARTRHDQAAARAVGIGLAILLGAFLLTTCSGLLWPAHPRDLTGAHAGDPLKPWFEQLASGRGLCCSFADGVSVQDVDWDTACGSDQLGKAACHYRVRIDREWFDVPETALVTEPNRFGPAVVWPFTDTGGNVQIRCFMPGALT